MRLAVCGRYPDGWPAIAARVKDAASWRCIRCNHPHDPQGVIPCDALCTHPNGAQLRAATGLPLRRSLTVHHLTGDKSDSRWWNLLALCQACHLSVQARVIPERPWLWEHTAWFRPYVAGFYAWYYGGLDITRQEAERHAERYLTLGQPWRGGVTA